MTEDQKRIEELEQEIEILKTLVLFDPLTGLLTRTGFKDEILPFFQDMVNAREHPDKRRSFTLKSLTLLFIDIDNFKRLNDTEGHAAGDKILKKVSETIENHVRGSDFVGRWGGEEILVALLGADENEAATIAENIRNGIQDETTVTISLGVAELTEDVDTLSKLIERADKAMYEAKKKGKNCVVKYSHL